MSIISTNRLQLRELNENDAEFIFRLLNQESWKKYIGDKQIDSIAAAIAYINNGPRTMYQNYGFGLWAVDEVALNCPIGICGLIKRDNLPAVDLGFAFLDEYTGRGYAYEACTGVINYAKNALAEKELLAIALPENLRSIKLLNKLGFVVENQHFKVSAADHTLNLLRLQISGKQLPSG